jgi:predicted dehydrogenase
MSTNTTRRIFLGAATAAAASRVWGANDRINVAIVGIGGRGTSHLNVYSKLPEAKVTGLCDVNQAAREVAQATLLKNTGEKAKEFVDMREVFADPGVDAVSIATPNHWHALATIWACKAGKDVYCEKPASYNIYEGQRMIEVQAQTKKMIQIGSQHRSTPFKMRGMEALHGGIVGNVYMAKGLCFKRRVSIGHKPDTPTPAGVDWDMFLGPAPMRPFNELRFKYNWHWFWDTGNGDIGNQGVHEMGIARWGLGDPQWPKGAVAMGGKYGPPDDQETPNTLLSSFDYGGRELVFEVRGNLTGGEGGAIPPRKAPAAAAGAPTGAPPSPPGTVAPGALNITVGNLFYGAEGWMSMNDSGYQIYKGESGELLQEEKAPREDTTKLHMQNFLAACHSRNLSDLHDPITNAFHSAALCHLANISYRSGHKLNIEAGPKFTGDVAATKMITREVYRKPYVV